MTQRPAIAADLPQLLDRDRPDSLSRDASVPSSTIDDVEEHVLE